ncbi:MAG: sugar ABC transporter permease [Clostridia bacterium]|nr:sugar ABC transporter permease [Clostridia bacterium]
MKLFQKQSNLIRNRNRWGYVFCAHWILGLAMFFVVPTVTSIYYVFSNINVGQGMKTTWVGLENLHYIFNSDKNFVNNMAASLSYLVTSLPIILSLSMVLALILNSKFRGRVVFRAIFFLPVIITGSVVMMLMTNNAVNAPIFSAASGGGESTYTEGAINFQEILVNLDLPAQIRTLIAGYLAKVFNLIWSCGIQTILFLAGLQSITAQLYEVAKIEGANRWETFWFIEVPMLRNIIMLVLLYTMIDLVTERSTPLMTQVSNLMYKQMIYDRSSAMLWIYFLCAGAIMGLILFLYNRLCIKKWE